MSIRYVHTNIIAQDWKRLSRFYQSVLQSVLAAGGQSIGEVVSADVPGKGRLTFAYATDPEGNILELQSWS